MPHSHLEPLEIQLESSDLVLRGFTGEELEPAVLNGELILNLTEPTNLKEIQLTFTGTAKVTWRDTSTHHYDHPLFFHDFNFLNPTPVTPGGSKAGHVHTLKAGRHVFPFTLHVPGSLPASVRTYSGTCVIEYKLKATAVRSGFGADWKSRKIVKIARGFGVDAVEYNQTLEIENTWPGKVMYAFTIPHKAYAAGDTIPVSVKFSPLAKGVQIASLITTIREHTTVHSKSSSHSEARDATVVKYNFVNDGAPSNPSSSNPPSRVESSASLSSLGNIGSTPSTPGFGTAAHGASSGNATASGSGGHWGFHRNVHNATGGEGESEVVQANGGDEEEDIEMDTEVDVVVDVPIPVWTAPTHTVHPVFINHKIKWSAFIKFEIFSLDKGATRADRHQLTRRNPDGHVSELRCALPIHILAASLSEEAALASSGSRNLLFGESGVLAHSDIPQVDLPSYQDHVMDRVANAETASFFHNSSGFTPTPWSCRTPGGSTPASNLGSPHSSPPPSRPSSPGPQRAHSSFSLAGLNMTNNAGSSPVPPSRLASRRSSGTL
ncbi:arrestin-related trafficking adapter 4/5/7, partial [Phenoliferia sp. Uapishka_3]